MPLKYKTCVECGADFAHSFDSPTKCDVCTLQLPLLREAYNPSSQVKLKLPPLPGSGPPFVGEGWVWVHATPLIFTRKLPLVAEGSDHTKFVRVYSLCSGFEASNPPQLVPISWLLSKKNERDYHGLVYDVYPDQGENEETYFTLFSQKEVGA